MLLTLLKFFRNEFDPDGRNLDVFFVLTMHPMFKRQAKFYVKPFLGHITFMVTIMSCLSSSVIYHN